MVAFLFIGFVAGLAVSWYFIWSAKREIIRLDEEKQLLDQEKKIVFAFMHGMVEAIGDGVSRIELFQQVVHSSVLSTGALSACIFERKGKRLRGVAIEGLFPPHRPLPESTRLKIMSRTKYLEDILKSEEFSVGEGLVGEVAQSGRAILIEDAVKDPRVIVHDDPSLIVRSVIVVPISFRQQNIAVLAIVNPADGGSFGDSDLSLAESIGEQAGLAIHNLDLMAMQIEKNRLDADLGLATEIQAMLLPANAQINDQVQIASVYNPAQKVGGDLFDYFPLENNRIGVAIADVSGKGVAASLVMAICQSNLRHLAKLFNEPSQVLKELNSVMVSEMKRNMFVTIIYAVIDLNENTICIARAGHELPILVCYNEQKGRWDGELIQSEGMALGMVPSEIFNLSIEDKTLPFNCGDIFTLYTDGVTERVNSDGTEYSNSRLVDTIQKHRNEEALNIMKNVLLNVDQFAGESGQADDVTLLTVKRV